MVKRKSLLVPPVILLLVLAVSPFTFTPGRECAQASKAKTLTDEELVRQFVSKRGLENAFIGIAVRNLKTGQTVLSYNNKKYFIPASNQKLLTTWAGLQQFGPQFRYETEVYVEKGTHLERGEINSGILIKGNGSPSFRPSQLARKLSKKLGSCKVSFSGNFVLDLSEFDNTYFASGWMWNDENNYIQALSLPLLSKVLDSPRNKEEFIKRLGQLIRSSLSARDISLKGGTMRGDLNDDWVKVLTIKSPPLSQILEYMNRFSINFTADTVFKSLSTSEGKTSFILSAELARNHLRQAGVKGKLRIVDGSGLSRYNMIQPAQVVQLLAYAFNHPGLREENELGYGQLIDDYLRDRSVFTSTLPDWGTGTMSSRVGDLAVKAKTGTLRDTSTLSGYILTDSNTLLAFSIMVNRTMNVGSARSFQTDLLKFLEERS